MCVCLCFVCVCVLCVFVFCVCVGVCGCGYAVLSAAMKEKDSELTALRKEVETRSEEKMAALEDQHQKEVHSLQTALAGRTVELESALSSLERLKREVEEKKEGLGSVSSHMMRLSKELEESRQAAEAVQKQLATERMENERLQVTSYLYPTTTKPQVLFFFS